MNKKIEKFEDIVAWQNARILTQDIYALFRLNKDFGFKDQIQRAAVSVMSNIAEGYERQTNKEFAQFLYIAKGSCAEIRSLLYIGRIYYIYSQIRSLIIIQALKEHDSFTTL